MNRSIADYLRHELRYSTSVGYLRAVKGIYSTPDKFHKGSQEKKHFSCGRSFSCVQPAPLSRFVLAFRSVSSGRYVVAVALLVFSPSGFHHFFATKPVRSETNKQYGCQVATMVPFGTRGP